MQNKKTESDLQKVKGNKLNARRRKEEEKEKNA